MSSGDLNKPKDVKFDVEVRRHLLDGVNILADAVKSTMGPRGRNVVIERESGPPIVTKDGVTVARAINLRHPFKNLGVQMVKEVASRTNDTAGDGTTTATVLSQALFSEGAKMVEAGYNPVEIKRGMEKASNEIILSLKDMSSQVDSIEKIKQVATVSSNGDEEIASLIVTATEQVGPDGVVTVEEAKGFKSSLECVEGIRIDRGFISPYFVTNSSRMTCELEDPYVLLTTRVLSGLPEILPVLEKVQRSQRSLLIIASEIENEALQALTLNKLRGILKVCAIRAPAFGDYRSEILQDIAAIVGGNVTCSEDGSSLESIELNSLGSCKKIIVSRSHATLIGGQGNKDNIQERSEGIKSQLQDPTLLNSDIHVLKSRLSNISGGVAILRVGGSTEIELRERKDRVEDALNATRAATEEGIVPGGGVALARCANMIKIPRNLSQGEIAGFEIVKRSCQYPLSQISRNAGYDANTVIQKISSKKRHSSYGFNAETGKFGDMFEFGIVDPVKVARHALESAVSVTGLMLTVDSAIVSDLSK